MKKIPLALWAILLTSATAYAADCQLDISEIPGPLQKQASEILSQKGYQIASGSKFLNVSKGELEKTIRAHNACTASGPDSYEMEIVMSVSEFQDGSLVVNDHSIENAIRCDQDSENDWNETQNESILKSITRLKQCPFSK